MNKPKKILIIDSYSMNTGDNGILMSMVDSIKRGINTVDIHIEASHPNFVSKFEELKNHEIFPRIFDIEQIDISKTSNKSKITPIFLGIIDSISFLMWAALKRMGINAYWMIRKSRRRQAEIISEIDLVVSSGGGFISTNYNYQFRLIMFSISFILKKPIFIFAQSIGPFDSWFSKRVIPFYLNRCEHVTVREPNTYKYLKKYSVRNIDQVADIAFLLKRKETQNIIKNENDKKLVSICVKDSSNKLKSYHYKDAILSATQYLIDHEYHVALVSQTKSDDNLICEIRDVIEKNIEIILFGANPSEVKAVYHECNFIIASRMHSLIFASEEGVPFISISYEPKFAGLMKMLGYYSELSLAEKTLSKETLLTSIDFIIKNHDSISESLLKKMPTIRKMSMLSIDMLGKLIHSD